MRNFVTLVFALALIPACVGDAPRFGSSTQYGESLNGESLNGESLNGESLNGESLNGTNTGAFTIWVRLDGVVWGGNTFDSTTLDASVFTATVGATVVTGADIAGAQFDAMRGDGTTVTLRINSVVEPTSPSTAWQYYVEYLETDDQWYPICKNAEGPLKAIPLNGIWDHHLGTPTGGSHVDDATKFTWGCEKVGALAKCALLGYEPWNGLADYHQSCVRLLRADYCGNGISYTTNGRLLNLYDAIGIQDDTDEWGIEAEWSPNGAACVTPHHRASVEIPCYDPALEATCGDLAHFSSGTLIMNELP